MIDELNIENRIESDRSETEKYEFIHGSCVFSLLFFQPNTIRVVLEFPHTAVVKPCIGVSRNECPNGNMF